MRIVLWWSCLLMKTLVRVKIRKTKRRREKKCEDEKENEMKVDDSNNEDDNKFIRHNTNISFFLVQK